MVGRRALRKFFLQLLLFSACCAPAFWTPYVYPDCGTVAVPNEADIALAHSIKALGDLMKNAEGKAIDPTTQEEFFTALECVVTAAMESDDVNLVLGTNNLLAQAAQTNLLDEEQKIKIATNHRPHLRALMGILTFEGTVTAALAALPTDADQAITAFQKMITDASAAITAAKTTFTQTATDLIISSTVQTAFCTKLKDFITAQLAVQPSEAVTAAILIARITNIQTLITAVKASTNPLFLASAYTTIDADNTALTTKSVLLQLPARPASTTVSFQTNAVLAIQLTDKTFLSVGGDGGPDWMVAGGLTSFATAPTQFTVTIDASDDNALSFKASNGKYLSAIPKTDTTSAWTVRASATTIGPSEKFIFSNGKLYNVGMSAYVTRPVSGALIIRTHKNQPATPAQPPFVEAPASDAVAITFVVVPPTIDPTTAAGKVVRLKLMDPATFALTYITDGGEAANLLTAGATDPAAANAQFELINNGDGTFSLRSITSNLIVSAVPKTDPNSPWVVKTMAWAIGPYEKFTIANNTFKNQGLVAFVTRPFSEAPTRIRTHKNQPATPVQPPWVEALQADAALIYLEVVGPVPQPAQAPQPPTPTTVADFTNIFNTQASFLPGTKTAVTTALKTFVATQLAAPTTGLQTLLTTAKASQLFDATAYTTIDADIATITTTFTVQQFVQGIAAKLASLTGKSNTDQITILDGIMSDPVWNLKDASGAAVPVPVTLSTPGQPSPFFTALTTLITAAMAERNLATLNLLDTLLTKATTSGMLSTADQTLIATNHQPHLQYLVAQLKPQKSRKVKPVPLQTRVNNASTDFDKLVQKTPITIEDLSNIIVPANVPILWTTKIMYFGRINIIYNRMAKVIDIPTLKAFVALATNTTSKTLIPEDKVSVVNGWVNDINQKIALIESSSRVLTASPTSQT